MPIRFVNRRADFSLPGEHKKRCPWFSIEIIGNSFVFKLILIVYLSLYFAIFNLYNLENPYVMIKALCLLVKLLVHANVLLVSWVKFFTIIGLGALCYFALYCYIYMLCYLQPDISIILFGSKSWDF